MKRLYVLLASAAVVAAANAARADTVSEVLGCEGDPCVVKFNPGGEIGSFKAAARELKRSGRRVVIDGPCLSACFCLFRQGLVGSFLAGESFREANGCRAFQLLRERWLGLSPDGGSLSSEAAASLSSDGRL